MRFNLNFVKEFLRVDVPAEELMSVLTMAGMEVECLEKSGDDWIFDIEVTTNRYDWLSIAGIAKEISANLGRKLKLNASVCKKASLLKERKIIIEDRGDCPFYVGRLIKGVKVGPSPDFIRKNVVNCGLNSINNVVDITNYAMLKWGNPLHAFDNDKIEGDVYIRRADAGEIFIGIDEKQRVLNKENLVIADEKKVIALAGVMGSKETEVCGNTKNIFLEAAVFSPLSVRKSRREAGLDTESSYRFERMVSPVYLEYASSESSVLMEKFAEGALCGVRQAGSRPVSLKNDITVSVGKMRDYLGCSFSKQEVKRVLGALDFGLREISKDKLKVFPPEFRFDVKGEVDVYEEFARIYGYDNIQPTIPFFAGHAKSGLVKKGGQYFHFREDLRRHVALTGFKEIITYSMECKEEAESMGGENLVAIINPLRKNEDSLRGSLLMGMLKCVRHNLNRNQSSLRFFEIADIYSALRKGFSEKTVLAMGASGKSDEFFYLKGAVEKVMSFLDIRGFDFKEDSRAGFSNALKVVISGVEAGFLGKLDRSIKDSFDLKEDFYFSQLDLFYLLEKKGEKKYKPFSSFPLVWRDLSVFLRKDRKFREVEEVIREENSYLAGLRVIDRYKGKDIPEDYSAFTVRVFYQSDNRTLDAQEIDCFHNAIRDKLGRREGISLR